MFLLASIDLFVLAVLPIGAGAMAWNNPFTVEMTAGSEQFPGLSGWARALSAFTVVWVPVMLYETMHTKLRALRGDTVFGRINAALFVRTVRWIVLVMGALVLAVNVWILITGYVWNFIQCIGSTLPEPLWCSPFSPQAVGAAVTFTLFVVLQILMSVMWVWAMFIQNVPAAPIRLPSEEQISHVTKASEEMLLRFLPPSVQKPPRRRV